MLKILVRVSFAHGVSSLVMYDLLMNHIGKHLKSIIMIATPFAAEYQLYIIALFLWTA